MSSACSQAVGLPELVAAILEQLHDTKALFAALQVNTLWADEATTVLWRVKPPLMAFARIVSLERLQYYAGKISVFDLWCDEHECGGHSKFQYLRFPRLSKISANQDGQRNGLLFMQCLQPKSRTSEISEGPITDNYLMQVGARCPVLQSLELYNKLGAITATDFLSFLNGMPSLTAIHLGPRLKDVISDEVYVHLASRPNLVALRTSFKVLTPGLVKRMQEVVDQPFPELVYLMCCSESEAFSQLSHHLTTLTELRLSVLDSSRKTVFDLCHCTSLVRLKLTFDAFDTDFDADSHFPPEGLLAIAKSCSHLQTFIVNHIQEFDVARGSITDITDDVIQEFVALLPGLSCFNLNVKTNLTHQALRILGEGCANLKECSLQGSSFHLGLLGDIVPVLFPQLESLSLETFEDYLQSERFTEILSHHAPRARYLDIGDFHWAA